MATRYGTRITRLSKAMSIAMLLWAVILLLIITTVYLIFLYFHHFDSLTLMLILVFGIFLLVLFYGTGFALTIASLWLLQAWGGWLGFCSVLMNLFLGVAMGWLLFEKHLSKERVK